MQSQYAYAFADTPAAEPVGRRSAVQTSQATMDFPTSEQPLVPQQPAYQSTTYGGTTYGARART